MANQRRVVEYTLCFLFIAIFIIIIFLSWVPPVSKDALTHHLAVPQLYLNNGGIHELPSMVFSYYPMNLDLLYLIPLHFGNDIVPKFIHFFFGVLTAWLIYLYLKRRIDHPYALCGTLFFLSIPIVVKLSISVYVDLGLIFFTTASLLSLLNWAQNIEKQSLLILSATCCGLAMGTKYNGLVCFIILLAVVPFICVRNTQTRNSVGIKAIGYAVTFGIIALLVFSPWMIQNYIWTNNPVFPLYDSWFNVESEASRAVLSVFTIRDIVYHESWWEIILLPVRIFFQGQDGNPQYFDGKLSPFLLILPFFAFYRTKSESIFIRFEKKILFAFVVLFFAFVFFSNNLRIRYILPIVPPLVILSVYGVKNIVHWVNGIGNLKTKKLFGVIISGMLVIAFLLNANYIYDQFTIVKPFEYLSGKITRDQYIERYRHEYPAMQYINRNLPKDAKVIFFYIGQRGYYCDREYVYDMINHKSTLHRIVKQVDNPNVAYRMLQEKGITHLLIRADIFNRWVSEDFSEKEKDVLKRFFREYVERIYTKNGYGVFRLR